MTEKYIDFMVTMGGGAPRTLLESIRLLSNTSRGFCHSWQSGEIADAVATSEEAFGLLDHIQNELLRRRDDSKVAGTWQQSSLRAALSVRVGELVDDVDPSVEAAFLAQPSGAGVIPPAAVVGSLSLDTALVKLKHRNSNRVNFTIGANGDHTLVVFTNGGMGKKNSLCSFEVIAFCSACRAAALAAK